MREYLTTSDIGRMCGGYTAQQVRNWWDAGQPDLRAAELPNPLRKHLRFKKTRGLEKYCSNKAAKANERATKRKSRQSRYWSQYHQTLLGKLVMRKKPNGPSDLGAFGEDGRHCDLTAFLAWKELSVKNRLTIDELNKSFRRGIVTRIKIDKGSRSAGVATWGGIRIEFDMLRRRIGDGWKAWTIADCDQVLDQLRGVCAFLGEIQFRRRDLVNKSVRRE
jgi:hypothetical protein